MDFQREVKEVRSKTHNELDAYSAGHRQQLDDLQIRQRDQLENLKQEYNI